MNTSSRSLEIKLISGEGLKEKNTFLIVRTGTGNAKMMTFDTEGGSYLAWEEKVVIDFPMHARYIKVEVKCKGYSGNKVIGTAIIPVSDFVGGFIPENCLQFLSYRLRDRHGERNGIINLSVRVRVPENGCRKYVVGNGGSYSRPWPVAPVSGICCNGIAVGIPVWHSHQILHPSYH